MRRSRFYAAAALTSAALVLVGCSDDKSEAGTWSASAFGSVGAIPTTAERMYQMGLDLVFPGEDVAEMTAIGHQACTYVRARGGVAADDLVAMVEISGELARATGNRFNESQYGYIVGLAATTLCADETQES